MEKHELVVSLAAVFLLALLSNGLNLALSFVVITLCCVNDAKYSMRFPCVPDFVYQGRTQGQTLEALLRDNPAPPVNRRQPASCLLPTQLALQRKLEEYPLTSTYIRVYFQSVSILDRNYSNILQYENHASYTVPIVSWRGLSSIGVFLQQLCLLTCLPLAVAQSCSTSPIQTGYIISAGSSTVGSTRTVRVMRRGILWLGHEHFVPGKRKLVKCLRLHHQHANKITSKGVRYGWRFHR